jgi:hypothetical protein
MRDKKGIIECTTLICWVRLLSIEDATIAGSNTQGPKGGSLQSTVMVTKEVSIQVTKEEDITRGKKRVNLVPKRAIWGLVIRRRVH